MSDDGRWLGRLNLPAGFDVLWLEDDRIWGVDRDELDVPHLVALVF